MERRQVVGLMVGPVAGAGAGAIIASLNSSLASSAEPLRLAGVACLFLSLGVWSALLLTAGANTSAESRKYIRLIDAGAWLYKRSRIDRQRVMEQGVPDLFPSAAHHAEAYVREIMQRLGLQFYVRRSEGLPLEPVSAEEANPSAFSEMFSEKPAPTDLWIRRTDLAKIRKAVTQG